MYRNLSGMQYQQCIEYLDLIGNELSKFGVKDFIDLDIFFWHISKDVMPNIPVKPLSKNNTINQINITKLEDPLPIETDQIETTFWVVRAGGSGKGGQENEALENNVITIGWHELSDISNFTEKDDLKAYYKKMISEQKDEQVAQNVGQVWYFLNEIKKMILYFFHYYQRTPISLQFVLLLVIMNLEKFHPIYDIQGE